MGAAATDFYNLGIGLDPSGMVSGAAASQDAVDKLAASVDRLAGALEEQGGAAKTQAKAHNDLGDAIEHHHIRLGLLERGFISLTSEMTGANHVIAHMTSALSEWAVGGEIVVGILAGITAISFVYDKLTESTKAAREEFEKLARTDAVMHADVVSGVAGAFPNAEAKKATLTLSAAMTALDHPSGLQLAAVVDLDRALAHGTITGGEFDRTLKKLKEDNPLFLKGIDESEHLANAFFKAKEHYDQLVSDFKREDVFNTGEATEADIAEMNRLIAEWEKFGKVIEATHEAQDKFNADVLGSNLKTENLLASMEKFFQGIHHAADSMRADLAADFKQEAEMPLVTEMTKNFVTAELEALKHNEHEVERLAQEPFKNALRGIQSDFASFFQDVFTGGVNTFGKLTTSIRDMFAKLVSELAAQQIMRKMLSGSPDLMRLMGIQQAPGVLSSGSPLPGIGAASLGLYSIGNAIGSSTSNTTSGTLLGGLLGGIPGAIGGFFGSNAKKHAEEVARAQKEEEESQVRASAHIRDLQSQGRAYEAQSAQLALQHQIEMRDAELKHYDAVTRAALQLAQAAEDAALAADQARRKQQDAANAITAEGSLFGESPAQTAARLADLFGFTGLSRDQILAQYTRGGGQLSADQLSRNDAVSAYLNLPGAPQGIAASTTTLGSVSSISAAQSDVMTGLLTSQVMWLSKIEMNTRSLAAGGMVAPSVNAQSTGAQLDALMSQRAMNRRAAVGAPRTPSPT